jgi:biopolymer transport protein ExbD
MRVLRSAGPGRSAGHRAVDLLLMSLVAVSVVQLGRLVVRQLEPDPQVVASAGPDVAPPPPQQIVLTLRADGHYLINGAGIDPRGLGGRLRTLYAGRPVKLLFVEAAAELPFRQVREAAEVAYRAGVETIGWLPSVPRTPVSTSSGGGRR